MPQKGLGRVYEYDAVVLLLLPLQRFSLFSLCLCPWCLVDGVSLFVVSQEVVDIEFVEPHPDRGVVVVVDGRSKVDG